jgi:glycosyltransferase involved in cell wall biosynthesis
VNTRLGVFLVGGIGGGFDSQGVPAITALTRALARKFHVSVYSLLRPDPEFRPDGYTICAPPPWLSGPARKLRWPWLAAKFADEHRRAPFAALLSFWGYPMGLFVVSLGKLVGLPTVITILGAEAAAVPSIGYGFLRRPVTRRLVLEACTRASAVVVLSSEQRDTLRRHGLRREVEVIPFGVDPAMFRQRPKRLLSPLKLLNVANLTPVKDQATLLRAFALIRRNLDAKLRLVGPDHMGGRLQRLATALGVQDDVQFVGPVRHDAIASHYDWADVFVLTSLSEGQNVALVEAAMSGVLLVSTQVGCIKDLGDGAAVVVRKEDPSDIATQILAVASDRAQWERKVAAARSWAESHDFRWTVERMTRVLAQARA